MISFRNLFRRKNVKESVVSDDKEFLRKELQETADEMAATYSRFDNISSEDTEALDACIYEMKALEARQRSLIKKFKAL